MQNTLAMMRPSCSIAKQVSDFSRAVKSAAVSFSTLEGGSMASSPKAPCASASSSSKRAASVKRLTGKSRDMFSATVARSRAQRGLDGRERRVGFGAVRAARLRHVGTSAALPAKHFPALAHEIDCAKARSEIVGNAHNNARLAIFRDADQRDYPRPELPLAFVGEAFQVLDIDAFDLARHQLDVADGSNALASGVGARTT